MKHGRRNLASWPPPMWCSCVKSTCFLIRFVFAFISFPCISLASTSFPCWIFGKITCDMECPSSLSLGKTRRNKSGDWRLRGLSFWCMHRTCDGHTLKSSWAVLGDDDDVCLGTFVWHEMIWKQRLFIWPIGFFRFIFCFSYYVLGSLKLLSCSTFILVMFSSVSFLKKKKKCLLFRSISVAKLSVCSRCFW